MSEKDVSEKDIPLGLEKLHEDLLLLNEALLGRDTWELQLMTMSQTNRKQKIS